MELDSSQSEVEADRKRERGERKQRQREGWLQFHTGSWGQICSGFLKKELPMTVPVEIESEDCLGKLN